MRIMKKFILLLILFQFTAITHSETLKLNILYGKWQLLYRGSYGYHFQFHPDFRSLCIIYLGASAAIFKGVYTLEDETTIRINIYEMKTENAVSNINLYSNFTKVTKTYFIFHGRYSETNNTKCLELDSVKTIIDGVNSEGYFEPEIKLNKIE